MTMARMPAESTMRQNASPRDSWLVAGVLRSPRTLMPSIIITTASVINPDSWPSNGQLRSKYPRRNGSSEIIRKTVICGPVSNCNPTR